MSEDRQGERREITWTLNPIRNESDQIAHFVAIGFDITLQRKSELAVYHAGKLITLGEMATGLAHEMNQPLAAIGLNVDVVCDRIANGMAEEGFISERLLQIRRQVTRATAIVDHMRIFGRRSERTMRPVDPALAIDGALTIVETQIVSSGISIAKHYQAGLHIVEADDLLIEQIMLNLLGNARDAILSAADDRSGLTKLAADISIMVRAEGDESVAIEVEDTGPGISPEHIDQIFDPFFTTKPVGKGTGLGLPLSYGMAHDMGGRLEAQNLPTGARFTLILRRSLSTSSFVGSETPELNRNRYSHV